jgi:hypothetical protein
MGLSGGGGGGDIPADTTTTIMYSPYVEAHHRDFLATVQAHRTEQVGSAKGNVNIAEAGSTCSSGVMASGGWVQDTALGLIFQPFPGVAASILDRSNVTGTQITNDSPYLEYADIDVHDAFVVYGYFYS